jgi:hypothetical protein
LVVPVARWHMAHDPNWNLWIAQYSSDEIP